MTNYSNTNSRLTIIRYLFRANVVDLQPMGDGMTRRIYPIGVQKVDERERNILQILR